MDYILGFVILLGVLIFIHEFGHFIAAKYFRMRVEVFSIGMGKKLFSRRWGETEYSLSLFPIGGYVKITGQDPREEVPPELASRAFRNKPLWDRTVVVLAGPLFNAILAYIIFVFLFAQGIPVQDAVLPRVLPQSPAYVAGFRSGDRVLAVEVGGKIVKVRQYQDFDDLVAQNTGKTLIFELERHNPVTQNQQRLKISFAPVLGKERDLQLPVTLDRGILPGLERMHVAPVISGLPKTWANSRRVPADFWVKELRFTRQGVEEILKVENFEQLAEAWSLAVSSLKKGSGKGELRLKGFLSSELMLPKGKGESPSEPAENTVVLNWSEAKDSPSTDLGEAGFVSSEFRVAGVMEKSPADKLGLQKEDLLLSLNGQALQSFNSFRSLIQDSAAQHQALKISLLRQGEVLTKELQAVEVANEDPDTGSKSKQFQIGVQFTSFPAAPAFRTLKAEGLFDNLALSWDKFLRTNKTMLGTFYYLAKGEISGKSLGGPLLIGKIAGDSFKAGGTQFLQMMSFLSLNLFIFNLLPIPVLDGGHLVLFAFEAVRRRPLGIKIIEIWTTTGFFILMGLIVFVFFNDISRLGFLKVFGL